MVVSQEADESFSKCDSLCDGELHGETVLLSANASNTAMSHRHTNAATNRAGRDFRCRGMPERGGSFMGVAGVSAPVGCRVTTKTVKRIDD